MYTYRVMSFYKLETWGNFKNFLISKNVSNHFSILAPSKGSLGNMNSNNVQNYSFTY